MTRTRIQWTPAEWEQVARELYRIRPSDEYLRSSTLASLVAIDFFQAQRVLPENRRRSKKSIAAMTVVRPGLVKAMVAVRAEVDAEALRKKTEIEQTALEAHAIELMEQKPAPAPVINPFEAAFAPLIDLIATEVTRRLQEMLVATMPKVASYKVETKTQTSPKKLKFGVIGPLGVQGQEIKKAFPDLEFVIIESGQAASSPGHVMGCDVIIGMTDFMNHSVDGVLKNRFGDRYHRTTGSTSKVKHLINILVNSMKHAQATA